MHPMFFIEDQWMNAEFSHKWFMLLRRKDECNYMCK